LYQFFTDNMHEENGDAQQFASKDLILVSVLSYFGFPVSGIERDGSGRATFFVARAEGLDAVIQAYWQREIGLEPQVFSNHMKLVKARLYANE
jgi:hypothetical protein